MAAYADNQDIIDMMYRRGFLVRPYVNLYGQNMTALAGGRDEIAADTSSSGAFLQFRANPASSYWTKINTAIQTSAPILVDIEPVQQFSAANIEAYNTAALHVLEYVRRDAPNCPITLYSSPPKQEYNGSTYLYSETDYAAALAKYDSGCYQSIDFYCIQAYQSYFFDQGYSASDWVPYLLSVAQARGETWAQVWAQAYDNSSDNYSSPNHSGNDPNILDDDEIASVASELVSGGVKNVLVFSHPSKDIATQDIANLAVLIEPFAERLPQGRIKSPSYGTKIAEFYFDNKRDNWDENLSSGVAESYDEDGLTVTGTGGGGDVFPSTFFNAAESNMGGSNLDLTDCCAELDFSLDSGDTSSNRVSQLNVRFNETTFDASAEATEVVWDLSQSKRKGRIRLPVSGYTLEDPSSSANVISDVAGLWFTPVYNSTYNGSISFRNLRMFQPVDSKGRIMIRLDDAKGTNAGTNTGSHYDHAVTADGYGIACSFSVPMDFVDTANFLTLSELQAIRDMSSGHCLLNHLVRIGGATSGTDGGWVTTSGSPTDIELKRRNVIECRELMRQNGIGEFADCVVVPGGYEGTDDYSLVRNGDASMIWYTVGGNATSPKVVYPWPLHEDVVRELSTNALWDLASSGDSVAGITAQIDLAIASRGLFIGHFHNMSVAQFDAICAHIDTAVSGGTLEVVTPRDLIAPYPGPNRYRGRGRIERTRA